MPKALVHPTVVDQVLQRALAMERPFGIDEVIGSASREDALAVLTHLVYEGHLQFASMRPKLYEWVND